MAGEKNDTSEGCGADARAAHVSGEVQKAKARKWFAKGRELSEARNFDFAIKCYLNGLQFWPDAVEEGHKPLRACGLGRRLSGGKKLGFADGMRSSMSGKDPLKAMLNAERLLAHDPSNISYMEGLLKNANRAHCEDTLRWAAGVYREGIESEKKTNPKRFEVLRAVFSELAERCQGRGDGKEAVEALEHAAAAVRMQARLCPQDHTLDNILRDITTNLTILKGKYETSDSFRGSIRDSDQQAVLHDADRLVQSEDRLQQLIEEAREDLAANPGVSVKVIALADLLCKSNSADNENRAVETCLEHYRTHHDYNLKLRADDIRMRQLAREVRRCQQERDSAGLKTARIEQLKFEVEVFQERSAHYPTDQRIRYELAVRLFQMRSFDEAIPLFQIARSDPRNRVKCELLLGRCFFEKGFYTQAIATLQSALDAHDVGDDDPAKNLMYWLARAQEADENPSEGKKWYGQILQLDYNFRDVRARLEKLSKSGKN